MEATRPVNSRVATPLIERTMAATKPADTFLLSKKISKTGHTITESEQMKPAWKHAKECEETRAESDG